MIRRLGIGLAVLGVVFAVDLLLGLPTYGLVRTWHGGTFNYTGAGAATLGWVLLWGLPGTALIAVAFWRLFSS